MVYWWISSIIGHSCSPQLTPSANLLKMAQVNFSSENIATGSLLLSPKRLVHTSSLKKDSNSYHSILSHGQSPVNSVNKLENVKVKVKYIDASVDPATGRKLTYDSHYDDFLFGTSVKSDTRRVSTKLSDSSQTNCTSDISVRTGNEDGVLMKKWKKTKKKVITSQYQGEKYAMTDSH